MQKNLCYRIPKYNADPYYDLDTNPDAALSGDIKTLNEQILPYLLETLGACVSASLGKTPVPCFEEKLGLDNPPDNTELGLYLDYLRTQPSSRVAPLTVLNSVEKVVAQRIFEPGFFPASSAATDDVFPHYENFVVVDGSALIP
jgi:hypothetical protein